MKELVELNDFLVLPDELMQWHENAELAADNLNLALHCIFNKADQDVEPEQLEQLLINASQALAADDYLVEFENEDEIAEWVDLFIFSQASS